MVAPLERYGRSSYFLMYLIWVLKKVNQRYDLIPISNVSLMGTLMLQLFCEVDGHPAQCGVPGVVCHI